MLWAPYVCSHAHTSNVAVLLHLSPLVELVHVSYSSIALAVALCLDKQLLLAARSFVLLPLPPWQPAKRQPEEVLQVELFTVACSGLHLGHCPYFLGCPVLCLLAYTLQIIRFCVSFAVAATQPISFAPCQALYAVHDHPSLVSSTTQSLCGAPQHVIQISLCACSGHITAHLMHRVPSCSHLTLCMLSERFECVTPLT